MSQNNKLYVGNLNFKTTEESLTAAFRAFGNVVRATVVMDRETGRARGFGFVEMETDAEAQAAIDGMNGAMVDGRAIQVNVARPREDRGPRPGGGGGGGGYGGGGGGGFSGGGGGGFGSGSGTPGGSDRPRRDFRGGDRGDRGGGRGGDRDR